MLAGKTDVNVCMYVIRTNFAVSPSHHQFVSTLAYHAEVLSGEPDEDPAHVSILAM
jgi:hypothetical protein